MVAAPGGGSDDGGDSGHDQKDRRVSGILI